MGTVVPFPSAPRESRASGVRAACIAGRWCIERLASGVIVGRTQMPTQPDAERIAARISRRGRIELLPARRTPRGRPLPLAAIGRVVTLHDPASRNPMPCRATDRLRTRDAHPR